ncbi:MAG: hypothetical protein N3A01_03635 [Bacteroidales bacterium]|nr:hypothetical protein [Bacteroidales bacterium]
MKTKIIILSGLLAILFSCSITKTTINDDIYSSTIKQDENSNFSSYYNSEANNIPQNTQTSKKYEQTIESSNNGDTYVTNNYYNFDPDDYYDFSYAARIRRFHGPYLGFGYFDGFYTNLYWYTYDPWDWGISIYFGYRWWPYYAYYYYPALFYVGFYYPWYYYYWHPYYYYYYDPFFWPCAWHSPFYSYWHGYFHGYWHGYWNGYYDALAYNYYYNSFDGTHYGPLSDIPTSGSHRESGGNYYSFVNTYHNEVVNKPTINVNSQSVDKPLKNNLPVILDNSIKPKPQSIAGNSDVNSKEVNSSTQRQPLFNVNNSDKPYERNPIVGGVSQTGVSQDKPNNITVVNQNKPTTNNEKPSFGQNKPTISQDRPFFNPPTYNPNNYQRGPIINEPDRPNYYDKPIIRENYTNRPLRINDNEIEYRKPSHNNYNRTIEQPQPSNNFNNRPSNLIFSQPSDNNRSSGDNSSIERRRK